jgi:hypothetical protein
LDENPASFALYMPAESGRKNMFLGKTAPEYSETHRFFMPFRHGGILKNDFLKIIRAEEGERTAFFN